MKLSPATVATVQIVDKFDAQMGCFPVEKPLIYVPLEARDVLINIGRRVNYNIVVLDLHFAQVVDEIPELDIIHRCQGVDEVSIGITSDVKGVLLDQFAIGSKC